MEIKTEVINDNKELTQEQKDKLAKRIADNFSKWDDDRASQIDMARRIMEETYLNQPPRVIEDERMDWKSDVKLNALYNIKRAKKSVIWREMWSNPSQMFDVRGTNQQTEEQAKIQKAAIVDSLNKMDIGKQYDNAVDNLFDIGEMIFKTDWEQRKKVVKRQKKDVGFVLMNVLRNITGAGYVTAPMQDVEIPYYENARVESVSPFMFVFDAPKYKLKNKDSWDSIIKIYKRFDSLDNIQSNKVYKLTDEQIQELKDTGKGDKGSENKAVIDLRDDDENCGELSILFAHGDFRIGGKLYKNYIAEVVAGKYLVRFEENPMYINPFILCALEFDPKTKRGISPLKAAFGMCTEEERLTNVALDAQKLTANPPCWVDESLLDESNTEPDGTIPLAPGKYIKYKSGFGGGFPQVMQFSSGGISDLLGLLGQKISDISSVSSVMYGNIEDSKRTATELSLADKGSNAQAGKELDTINQDFTIPMIKNVAELLAMFKDGTDFVYAQEKGKNIEYKITNSIRQAEYNYIYEDRNALHDRKAKVQELYQIFQGAAQFEPTAYMVNWKEVLITLVETVGYDNVDKFFNDETPSEQFAQDLKQLPEQIQQQLIPIFMQQAQQAMQQMQQQEQQAQMQAQAQNQVQRDMYRQQVRDELVMQNISGNETI
ncbi:MAG: hypothetical protein NC408_04415 [Candidatus Gastranaerophilales bacterium]|nr:hypothetical protein [Candidatus Gastranaerophilales bacterium]MCM1072285.1 hypothetical protein [Bacteroides sp.]